MRIIRDTPEQMIIANKPWLIGIMLTLFILVFIGAGILVATGEEGDVWFGILFGGLGGGIGIAAFCAFVRRVQIIFDRPSGTITIRRQSVFGYNSEDHPLEHLSHVEIEQTTTRQNGHNSTLYRPTLVLEAAASAPNGETRIPIVAAYTNGVGPNRIAKAVNSWLPAKEVA
ncbi:hypothetical protein [Pseudophaeobacter sp.]|uniref:hypothetical protein n=1 Tax=Pseudophaeobacter sp. TaxID=1971739 RepID=UPI00329779C8